MGTVHQGASSFKIGSRNVAVNASEGQRPREDEQRGRRSIGRLYVSPKTLGGQAHNGLANERH